MTASKKRDGHHCARSARALVEASRLKAQRFWYEDAKAKRVTNEEDLARIKELVLRPHGKCARLAFRAQPPASHRHRYKGRVQYRYHATYAASQQRKNIPKSKASANTCLLCAAPATSISRKTA
jgi:hypothetical protein